MIQKICLVDNVGCYYNPPKSVVVGYFALGAFLLYKATKSKKKNNKSCR